jgi:hypothetical protein
VPGHVLRIPPGILQSLPEQTRLPDAPDFMPPRHHPFLSILHHEFAQRIHQVRPQLLQPLVVSPKRQLSQRLLRIGRRLAINAQRSASGHRSLRGRGAIQRCNETIVRRVRATVQNRDIVKISHDVLVGQASACQV